MIFNLIRLQLKNNFKNTNSMLQLLVLPSVLVLIIGYLTKDVFSSEVSSYQYYYVGVMLFMYIGYGVNSSFNFIDKNNKEGNLRLMFVPMNNMWIYASHIISGTIFGAATVVFNMLIFKFLFHLNYNHSQVIITITIVTIIMASSAVGILLSILIDNAIIIEEIFTICQLTLSLLGGCFFSIESISNIPTFVAYISPVKWIMDGMIDCLYKENTNLLHIVIVINICISFILVILCNKFFKEENYI